MAVIKLEAIRALAEAIKAAVPELEMHTYAGQAPPSKGLCLPSLAIMVTGSTYEAMPENEAHVSLGDTLAVYNVGLHKLRIQLRLAAATLGERYEIEDKIVNAFLVTELHPGVLLTQVTACEELGEFLAAWEFESSEWRDEKAFDSQFWAVTEILGQVPALVTRAGAHSIDDLRLGLTHDFSQTIVVTSPTVEVIRINSGGTITKL